MFVPLAGPSHLNPKMPMVMSLSRRAPKPRANRYKKMSNKDLVAKAMSQKEREKMQARVGLASNIVGLTAGAAAMGASLKDDRLKDGGKVARKIYAAGQKMPSPTNKYLSRINPTKAKKISSRLAVGAAGLQAGNIVGDAVANRVLSRESK